MDTSKKDIDSYIADFPAEVQAILEKVRSTIHKAAPAAQETISYGIPTFVLHGNLVHFAGYKHHIGFYPGSAAIEAFKKDITAYKVSKGTVQFPLDQPMPLGLITKIVKYRVTQSQAKAVSKTSIKK